MKSSKFFLFAGILILASGGVLVYVLNIGDYPSSDIQETSQDSAQPALSDPAGIRQTHPLSVASSSTGRSIQPAALFPGTPSSTTPADTRDGPPSASRNQYPAPVLSTSLHDTTGKEKLTGLANLRALRGEQISLNPLPINPEPETVPPGTASQSPNDPDAVELAIPPGAILPAGFYDDIRRTEQQTAALNRILLDFHSDISTEFPGMTTTEVWESARHIADERYKVIFGAKAFNERHLAAAKEAVRERRALKAAENGPPDQDQQ